MDKLLILLNNAMCEEFSREQWEGILDLYNKYCDNLVVFLQEGIACVADTLRSMVIEAIFDKYNIETEDIFFDFPDADECMELEESYTGDPEVITKCIEELLTAKDEFDKLNLYGSNKV